MGIFFKSGASSDDESEVRPAIKWALNTVSPAAHSDAIRLVDAKVAEAWPNIRMDEPLRAGLADALMTPTPAATDVEGAVGHIYAGVRKKRKKVAGADGPNWPVFIAAALLLLVLLAVTTWVAVQADAQPKDVTSSQLKSLSTTLSTAFTSLLGAIVGMITGEAVTKKDAATGQ